MVEKFYKRDEDGNFPEPRKVLKPRGQLMFVEHEEVKAEFYDLDERGEPPVPR